MKSKKQSTQTPTLTLNNIHIEGDLITMSADDWLNLDRWREEMCIGTLISPVDIISSTAPLAPTGDTPVTRKFNIRHLRPIPRLATF